ncbi:MAG: very short patch repair endonuclease [Candidatus Sulfotelmatobacter sp.]
MGRGNSSTGTVPERLLQAALRKKGLRFRANVPALPGCPDIVLRECHVAIFCDGDFWHGRRWSRRREKMTRGANADYWISKIERNIRRDREVTRMLRKLGWRVVRVWESAVLTNIDRAVGVIVAAARETSCP